MQNILILGLLGVGMLAYAVPATVYAYRQMRYPSPLTMGLVFIGDALFVSAVAAALIKYVL